MVQCYNCWHQIYNATCLIFKIIFSPIASPKITFYSIIFSRWITINCTLLQPCTFCHTFLICKMWLKILLGLSDASCLITNPAWLTWHCSTWQSSLVFHQVLRKLSNNVNLFRDCWPTINHVLPTEITGQDLMTAASLRPAEDGAGGGGFVSQYCPVQYSNILIAPKKVKQKLLYKYVKVCKSI